MYMNIHTYLYMLLDKLLSILLKFDEEVFIMYTERLMILVLEAETYGGRRGAAYGLSAFVKGLGIPSLKAHNIVPRLKEACETGAVNARQVIKRYILFMSI
jgi:hypothetical protein